MHCTRTILNLRILFLLAPSISLVLAGCGIGQVPMPTSTSTPLPTALPTNTPVPTETPTPEPSFTPTLALPDGVQQMYTGISIVAHDDFNSDLPDFPPPNWATEGDKMFVNSDGTLEFNWKNQIAYYTNTFVTENHAIIVRFKFAPYSHFDIGMDGVRQGVRIPSGQPGFRSITMEYNFGPIPEFNADTNKYASYFKGNLKLVPNTWYLYSLTFAPDKQFIIKVWDPNNPSSSITAIRQMNEMSNANVFIMWADTNAVVTLDDFTIIQFTGMNGQ